MANPQKENGYVPVANEIFEALARTRIPGEARQVLDLIIRKTYGFNKKEDHIALSQMVLGTGLKKAECCRSIRKLLVMNLVVVGKYATLKGKTYRFNKDFDTWVVLAKKPPIGKYANKSLAKKHTTKDNIQKTYINIADKSAVSSLFGYFSSKTESLKGYKPAINYAKEGAMVKRLAKQYTPQQLEELIDFFLESEKSDKFPTLATALSADTINQWQAKGQKINKWGL